MVLPDLPLTKALVSELHVLDHADSTNDVAREFALAGAPHFTLVVTDDQRNGRGRLGRTWVSPPGKCLAASLILRPTELFTNPDSLGWISLIAGLAMTRAVNAELEALGSLDTSPADNPHNSVPSREAAPPLAGLKWPNDVLINSRKVSGILSELNFDQQFIVVGSGLNLTLNEEELPTDTSTSIQLHTNNHPDTDRVLSANLAESAKLLSAFVASAGDAHASGIHTAASEALVVIGEQVTAKLPDGSTVSGVARSVDASGSLNVETPDGSLKAISSGDISTWGAPPVEPGCSTGVDA